MELEWLFSLSLKKVVRSMKLGSSCDFKSEIVQIIVIKQLLGFLLFLFTILTFGLFAIIIKI